MKKNRMYYRGLNALLLIIIVILITACDKKNVEIKSKTEGNYKIYYVDDKDSKIVYQSVLINEDDTDSIINELINKLKVGQYEKSKKPVIPNNIEYTIFNLNENVLSLTFDDNYLKLKGVDEVLRRASIVLTLSQINQVEYVRMNVNSKPLVIDKQDVGNMSKDTFIDMVGNESDYKSKEDVILYFADSSGKKLRKLNSKLTFDGTVSKEKLIVQKLIEGPVGEDKLGYYATMNPKTKINRLVVNNKICYIDFNEEFLEKAGRVTEDVTIYSIVNSLTELNTVNQVRITINGDKKDVYIDYCDISGLIDKDYNIINHDN